MIEQVIIYPCIIAVSLLNSSEFFNLVVFHGYDKIAFMMLCADENLAARGNFEQFLFDYEVLREATGNFDGNNMLGKGGYGEVYKV